MSMCVEDRERHVHGALCCVTWRHIYIIRERVCEIHMRTWGEMCELERRRISSELERGGGYIHT